MLFGGIELFLSIRESGAEIKLRMGHGAPNITEAFSDLGWILEVTLSARGVTIQAVL